MKTVMVVSSNFYNNENAIERLQKMLGADYEVFGCYRVYHAKEFAAKCDFIIGGSICKDRDDNGYLFTTYFSSSQLARKNQKPYLPSLLCNPLTAWMATAIIKLATMDRGRRTAH